MGRGRQAAAREGEGHGAERVRRERAGPSPVALAQEGRPQQERRQRLVHRRYTNSTATPRDNPRRRGFAPAQPARTRRPPPLIRRGRGGPGRPAPPPGQGGPLERSSPPEGPAAPA